jgi:endonuclease YncB( thermonuclease family)
MAVSLGLLGSGQATVNETRALGTVVRVVDGDTLDVQLDGGLVERIRLIGIDAPELVDPRTAMQCFAEEASTHARELLDGQAVALELDLSQSQRDAFGRTLAYVWLPDGRNFGEVMIADGFAHEYTFDQPYADTDAFRSAQDGAIRAQTGIWSPTTCAGDTAQAADSVAVSPRAAPALAHPVPPPAPGAARVAPVRGGFDPAQYIGQGDRYSCPAFASQSQAQAVLRADPRDPNKLDADRDGIACESNLTPRDLARVLRA